MGKFAMSCCYNIDFLTLQVVPAAGVHDSLTCDQASSYFRVPSSREKKIGTPDRRL